ncbi:MAG: hypothetical protein P0S96_01220 [Simkaniaceae bacterium]|nr:hypothetical protein [Candidatus Sacchlamyda saccharinae]
METIITMLRSTPWWVYLLFFYVLYIGIRALKPRTFSVNKLFIVPLIVLALTIWNLIDKFESFKDLLIWALFIPIGFAAGWGIVQSFKIRGDHKKLLIRMPGSPFILVLLLFVFVIRYFFGYMKATTPDIGPVLHSLDLAFSGIFLGLFIGRLFATLKKFGKTKHEKLKKT